MEDEVMGYEYGSNGVCPGFRKKNVCAYFVFGLVNKDLLITCGIMALISFIITASKEITPNIHHSQVTFVQQRSMSALEPHHRNIRLQRYFYHYIS